MATKVILREHDALESKYASSDVFGLLWGFGRPDFGALGCFSQRQHGLRVSAVFWPLYLRLRAGFATIFCINPLGGWRRQFHGGVRL